MTDEVSPETASQHDVAARKTLMQACAKATKAELSSAVDHFGEMATAVDVRRPETGLVMLRGRIGGDGAPFNVGEATVTRATVRLASGEVGHSYLLGRSEKRARLSAILDAVGQSSQQHRAELEDILVAPVRARTRQEKQVAAAETAATRVNFFTMVRGED